MYWKDVRELVVGELFYTNFASVLQTVNASLKCIIELQPSDWDFSVVGRIRNKPEVDDSASDAVLSLNIISAKYLKSSHNSSRYVTLAFRITVCKPDVAFCPKHARIGSCISLLNRFMSAVNSRLCVYSACMKGLQTSCCLEFRRGYEHESLPAAVSRMNKSISAEPCREQ